MRHGEKADLSHIFVIGARTFVHIKNSRKLDATAWKGKLSLLQDLVPSSWDFDDDTLNKDYNSYEDLLRGVRDYTDVPGFTANIFPLTTRTSVACRSICKCRGYLTNTAISPGETCSRPLHLCPEPHHQRNLCRSSRGAFVRGIITAELRGSVARNSGTFAVPRPSYSEKGDRCVQQQDSSPQRRHAACCRGADGRGYPLQESKPQQQQQQQRGSGGTFPAKYAARNARTRFLHQRGHAGYCASAL